MGGLIIAVDRSRILGGRLAEVRAGIRDLAEFVEAHESRPIVYRVYLDEAAEWMTVVQVHPDSASMEAHLELAGPVFRRFSGLIQLSTMDIYGRPSESLVAQLRAKVALLGDASVSVHRLEAGFARFAGG